MNFAKVAIHAKLDVTHVVCSNGALSVDGGNYM